MFNLILNHQTSEPGVRNQDVRAPSQEEGRDLHLLALSKDRYEVFRPCGAKEEIGRAANLERRIGCRADPLPNGGGAKVGLELALSPCGLRMHFRNIWLGRVCRKAKRERGEFGGIGRW